MLILFFSLTIPWVIFWSTGVHLSPLAQAIFSGLAIVGAGYILSEFSEIAQIDVPRGFALAVIALIAVLPEYVVDLYFAWMAPKNPHYASYASANMTGANRLLIGFGWALIVFLNFFKTREKKVVLREGFRWEMGILAIATLYSFSIPIRKHLSFVDTAFFIGLFAFYTYKTAKGDVEEIETDALLFQFMKSISKIKRGILIILGFLYGGFVVFISAEHFAEGLLKVGESLKIEKFILVQWVAPLASEAPELIVAIIFVLKGKAENSLGMLVSSKINQWTLLVGCIPLVYSISGLTIHPLELDMRQNEEIFLTSAQSLFALIVLSELDLDLKEGTLLFLLFFVQLVIPNPHTRLVFSFVYVGFSLFFLLVSKKKREGFINLRKGF
jgi:cation:H+ antiporter